MGRQRGQIPVEVRKLIIKLYEKGKSLSEIKEIVDRSRSSIHNIIKRFKENKQIENKPRKSNRKIFSEWDERWILRAIKKTPKLNAVKLTKMVEEQLNIKCSAETVRNVLRKFDFHGRVARRKPFLSKANKMKRLKFAKKYAKMDISFWENVIFTDESKFNLYRSDGRTYVWRKANEELLEKNIIPTIKRGIKSVMVWGCMAIGTGNLEIVEGKWIIGNIFQF